ncbi:hypothetical protein CYLTODRAFT_68340 [Cylindrobasidium torrendii FP15055 ss-10]|uniref:DUF6534 domain-containing protein n=1 Tax=Cylindrobasidium torrendii FP15055 ss-10 TaxID=1314674 RepID=A0A0D7B6W1_9AGAR|nr:hypothetical protein CYLTODRAFT_68340 [Cylindrobasidium torrendii FP15055 ss-10]
MKMNATSSSAGTVDPVLLLSLPKGVTLDNTLGAVLVGFAAACCVYGILLAQMYTYFARYPLDRWFYKLLVGLILVLVTADQALIGHIIYFYGITNFANPAVLLRASVTWSFILQQTIGSIVGCIVKTMFALRVWRFSERNYWITGLILILTYGQLAIAFTVKAFELAGVFDVVHLSTLGTVSLGIGVVTDIVTALSLTFFLNKLRTGYHQSDSLVNSLVRYAFSTGAFTCAVSITTLILYNLLPNNLVFIASFFILSKLYAISMMATLNTRRIVRGQGTDKQGTTTNHTNMFHLGTRMPSIAMDNWDTRAVQSRPRGGLPDEYVLPTDEAN